MEYPFLLWTVRGLMAAICKMGLTLAGIFLNLDEIP
jgi:hypothetical protein